MYGIRVIFKREVRQYFTSPIAYLVAFAVLFLNGMIFALDLRSRNGFGPLDSTYILGFFGFIMIFLTPLLTMRLLAEESREGTFELLLTMPIRDGDIVMGKFLGAWLYFTLLLLSTLVYQVILASIGYPDMGAIIAAYIGIWLYGGAVIAVGLLFSALTENQIVAGFLSMAVLFILWLADSFGALFSGLGVEAARFVRTLSLRSHHSTSFLLGIFRLEDVVFYVGLITVMLFITTQIVAARRWRG